MQTDSTPINTSLHTRRAPTCRVQTHTLFYAQNEWQEDNQGGGATPVHDLQALVTGDLVKVEKWDAHLSALGSVGEWQH
jgi:hypothetical protein